ncbi:MAG: hypothetical protein R8F63_12525 [Acidimicrobiales bacterium]|nr:hypothetical protein [Acidimicrobiales bacterium]
MDRRWVFLAVASAVAVFAVLVTVDTPSESRRQEMATPRGDEAFEIDLDGAFVDDGAVTRAWAVDPYGLLGDDVTDRGNVLEIQRGVGGYDALALYTVFPNCPWAPEVRIGIDGDRMDVDLRSFGGCDADSIRVTRAVALEFAPGVDPATMTIAHRDP